MGLDILDLMFRSERSFKIRLHRGWETRLGVSDWREATLRQYHELLLLCCREQGIAPPVDSWAALQRIVADASGVKAPTPDARLKDLFSGL